MMMTIVEVIANNKAMVGRFTSIEKASEYVRTHRRLQLTFKYGKVNFVIYILLLLGMK